MTKKMWIAFLVSPFVLYLLFVSVCAVWLNTSGKVAELQKSIGDYALINRAGGKSVSYGTLGCAEIVPADGRFRFKVTLLSIDPNGKVARGVTSVTLDFWELDAIEVVEQRDRLPN